MGFGSESEGEVCEECREKCMLMHGRKIRDPSPVVTSFFKIMLGDTFHSVMFIPPMFARTIRSLAEQKVILEDSNGKLFRIELSMVDGQLAFKQGWHQFVLDHSLEIGDFLVFNYHIGSHFLVQIYGKNCCEKRNFSKNRSADRGKRDRPEISVVHLPSKSQNLPATEAPSHMNVEVSVSVNKQGSSSADHFHSDLGISQSKSSCQDVEEVPLATKETPHCYDNESRPHFVASESCTEVPFCMIDRTAETVRSSLFDLSNFEIAGGKNRVEGQEVIDDAKSSHSNDNLVQSKTNLETNGREGWRNITFKESPGKRGADVGAPCDLLEFEVPRRKCKYDDEDKVTDKVSRHHTTSQLAQNASTLDRRKTEMENLGSSNATLKTCPRTKEGHFLLSAGKVKNEPASQMRHGSLARNRGSIQQFTTKNPTCKKASCIEGKNYPCGKRPVIEEKEDGYPSLKVGGNTCKVVKTEAVDSVDFHCSVSVVTQSFLVLPKVDLPSFSCRGRTDSRILLLRDPALRIWPVFYHEKFGLRILTTGWEALAKANNIRQGDDCFLTVENESEGLFELRVTRK